MEDRKFLLSRLLATKRNQLLSVHFDLLQLEAILEVCLFGTLLLKVLVFSSLEEDEDEDSFK